MKRNVLIPFMTLGFLYGCSESEIGQYAVDNVSPDAVRNITVENLKGAAVISYDIPNDEDLLYVKVIYKLDNGQTMEQKASAYANSVKVEGLGRSREQEVQIVTGDRSKNESAPVSVTIHPQDAPIYDVFNSLQARSDFGGIRVVWDNPDRAGVVISILEPDATNELIEVDNFYSDARNGAGNVRGYNAEERLFAVFVRDRWQNHSDTLIASFLPLHEERLDKSRFSRWNPSGIPYNTLPGQGWDIEKAWDNIIQVNPGFSTNTGGSLPTSITFSLGQDAVLSRFKIFQRGTGDQQYTGANIKRFELWGSDHPNVNADLSTWVKLGEFESIKPSGPGPVTEEDTDYAVVRGEDFAVDSGVPRVRYLRLVVHETWGGTTHVQFMELDFYGNVQ